MNKTFLIGRLTADPQGGTTDSGKKYARFTLAVNRYNDGADFIRITAWDKLAENVPKYLVKGRQAAVVGSIQISSYEKNGVNMQRIEVRATDIEFIGSKDDAPQKPNNDVTMDQLKPVDDDDDMPF